MRGRHGPLLLALLAATAGLLPAAAGGPPARLRVITTTTDLRALAEVVGGDRVSAESLLGGAQPPHVFQAKPSHLAALRAADLVVRIGLDHDAWLAALLKQAGNARLLPGRPGHVDASRGIELLEPAPRTASGAGHVHAFGNTHYWLDPENARPITAGLVAAFTRAAPADGAEFAARRAAFVARLDEGLRRWTAALAPYRGVRVVAVHDSFPYLAQRFGLVVAASLEPHPGVAPPPAHLARIVRDMKRHGIRLVLSEAWLPDDLARRVASEAGGQVARLPTSVDSGPGTGDYLALFDAITARLAEALKATGAGPGS
ncbi:MAG TPA: metal ABC transporter substrate-binding protein [Methylomirabilota bacterium]|nr:metal ABC transporter substrate-binding protein [Methylomirabilota bacterium]